MAEHMKELRDVAESVLASRGMVQAHGDVTLDRGLWRDLDQLGFTTLTLPEHLGGSGGDLNDAAVVTRAAAVAAVPVMEASFLAGPVLSRAGLAWPGGVITAALAPGIAVEDARGAVSLSGRVPRVPWLRDADHLVLVVPHADGALICVIPAVASGLAVRHGRNLAGEPRDDASLTAVRPSACVHMPDPDLGTGFMTLGAVGRSVQMAGGAAQVLALTVRHVRERVQFGRPLAKFQAVQHQIARLAAEVAVLQTGSDAAVLALRDGSASAPVLAAAAKAEASALARTVAAVSHQLHGAIGFTREHQLGNCTRRLWAWRDEYGNELEWRERLVSLAEAQGHDIWTLVTGVAADDREAANT